MQKSERKDSFLRIFFVLMGILMYSLSLDLFLTGNKISAGGFAGAALVIGKYIPLGIGVIVYIMNVPLLIASIVVNGWRYGIASIIYATIYSATIDLLSFLPTLSYDPLVASVYGGVLYGIGMACITLGKCSIGGTDLLSRLLLKAFPNMSMGKMCICIDGTVIVLSMIAFGSVEIGLYAIITIFLCSVVCDYLIARREKGSVCLIITNLDPHEVADPLMRELGISVTGMEATGMYTDSGRTLLLSVVRPREAVRVKRLLAQIDPNAFVILQTANEMLGGRYKGMSIK